jgi:spore germination cell wall hydrolase CwlJ-like protein
MRKLIPTVLLSVLAFLPISSQQQTISFETAISQDIGKQVLCMAKNIYYEAAMEPYEGKLAVAQVTINRANSSQFPSTICDVVYQKVNNTYQFSWVGEKVSQIKNKYAWEESLMVARKALTETRLHDTIYRTKAMYYHNTSVNPGWKLKYVAKIGNHLFYTRT